MSAGRSESRPWHARERPDVGIVRRIVEGQFPALAGASVRYFAEGWDFTVFAVGEDRLFRFPKREATLPWLARELVVLDAIQGRVPAPLPSDRMLGVPTEEYPFPFVGYRRLDGVPLDGVPPEAVAAEAVADLSRTVGSTLRVVHEVPLSTLPPAPSPRDEMDVWIRTALEVLGAVADLLPAVAVARCRARLEGPPPLPEAHVLTHGDLGPEHILVDEASHELTGLIDWTDTGPCDAAGDFVGLWAQFGEPGLDAALQAYDEAADPALAERVRFHGTRWLLHQVRTCDQGWRPEIRGRWLRRIAERGAQ